MSYRCSPKRKYKGIVFNNSFYSILINLLADAQRTEKARFWWHWLDATNDNPEEEWRWTVKGKEIPLSVTPTHWDFEEPANSKLME